MAVEHRYPLLQQGFLKPAVNTKAVLQISGTDSGKAFINTGASGSTTYDLPKAAPGLVYRFVETTAQNMVIQPISTDAIRGSSAGVPTTLSSLGAKLLLTCVIVGSWELF